MTSSDLFSLESLDVRGIAEYVSLRLAGRAPPPVNAIHGESLWAVLYAATIDWHLRSDERATALVEAVYAELEKALDQCDPVLTQVACDLLTQLALSPQAVRPKQVPELAPKLAKLSAENSASLRVPVNRLRDAWGLIDATAAEAELFAACANFEADVVAESAQGLLDAFERCLRIASAEPPGGEGKSRVAQWVAWAAGAVRAQTKTPEIQSVAMSLLRLSWLQDKSTGRQDLENAWRSFLETNPVGADPLRKKIWLAWGVASATRFWKTTEFRDLRERLELELDDGREEHATGLLCMVRRPVSPRRLTQACP